MKAKFTITLFTCLLFNQLLLAQWQQMPNTQGTTFYSFAASGSNMYAGSSGKGIYQSTDNGNTWTQMSGLKGNNNFSMAISGANILAGDDSCKIHVTNNNGSSWGKVFDGFVSFGLNLQNVYAMMLNGSNVVAGTGGTTEGSLFLSTNNGSSWTQKNSGLPGDPVLGLAAIGPNIFAGTFGGGVYVSANNGNSWTAANSGMTDKSVQALTVDGSRIYAGTGNSGVGNVYVSLNNGSSWIASNTGLPGTGVYAMAANGSRVFAGFLGNGVYYSTSNGLTWAALNAGLTNMHVWALYTNGTYLFAATENGIFRRSLADMPSGIAAQNVKGLNDIMLYPNPVKNELYVESGSFTGLQFELLNLDGKNLCSGLLNEQHTINMFDFVPGIYLLRIVDSSNQTIVIKRVIKQ